MTCEEVLRAALIDATAQLRAQPDQRPWSAHRERLIERCESALSTPMLDLDALLASTRERAIEQCALLADAMPLAHGETIARAIRALAKGTP